jgi:hypothetical protein
VRKRKVSLVNIILFVVLIFLNIPLYWLLGKSFFGSWDGFLEALVSIFRSNLHAALSGSYEEHRIGRFTLLFYVLLCMATVAAEYHVVAKYILRLEHPWDLTSVIEDGS